MRLRVSSLFATVAVLTGVIFASPTQSSAKRISVNVARGSVTVEAFINYRYLRNPNLSILTHRKGYNAKRSLFISEATPIELHDALVQIGVKAGDNLSLKSPAGRKTEGDRLLVYVSWKGIRRIIPLSGIVVDEFRRGADIRFSGNRENMKEIPTGYLLTAESSPLSVAGSARLGLTRYGYKERKFRVKKSILPPNGTAVKLIFFKPKK